MRKCVARGRERAEARVVVGCEEEVKVRVLRGRDARVRRGRREWAAQRLQQIADPDGDVDARFPC